MPACLQHHWHQAFPFLKVLRVLVVPMSDHTQSSGSSGWHGSQALALPLLETPSVVTRAGFSYLHYSGVSHRLCLLQGPDTSVRLQPKSTLNLTMTDLWWRRKSQGLDLGWVEHTWVVCFRKEQKGSMGQEHSPAEGPVSLAAFREFTIRGPEL